MKKKDYYTKQNREGVTIEMKLTKKNKIPSSLIHIFVVTSAIREGS